MGSPETSSNERSVQEDRREHAVSGNAWRGSSREGERLLYSSTEKRLPGKPAHDCESSQTVALFQICVYASRRNIPLPPEKRAEDRKRFHVPDWTAGVVTDAVALNVTV